MKTYSWPQLKNIVREQSYKMAALQDHNGERVVPFNVYNKRSSNLDSQFKLIQTRLRSDQYPDGYYFVLLAVNINACRNPHSYPILKGKPTGDIPEPPKPASGTSRPVNDNVLSWSSAVEMNSQIAELKAELAKTQFQRDQYKKELDELKAQQEDGLSEPEESPLQHNTLTFLKEFLPGLTPLADRYFDLEERKLDLKQMELTGKKSPSKGTQRKTIIPGSQDHLNIIEHYYNKNDDDRLNIELDKLEKANPGLYAQVIERLGLEEETGEESGTENGGGEDE